MDYNKRPYFYGTGRRKSRLPVCVCIRAPAASK